MVATGMATVMVTVPMVMVTEQCWSMKMIVLVVVLCKPFVTMVSADAGLVMMPGMANVGKTSIPSTTMIGMKGKVLDSTLINHAVVMMLAKKLT